MAVAAVWSAPALRAAGDSPAGAYQEALAHERRVREPGARPALDAIRGVIAAYEAIEQRFPSSGYGDRAIWQAAGLAVEAYDRYRDGRDFETGVRLLRRLERRHGDSPLARRAAERRSQLDALARIAQVTAIEREIRDDVVRVLIGLDRDVAFRSERLDDPGRLFFDFPETDALDPFRNAAMAFEDGDGVAESIRLGRHPDRTTASSSIRRTPTTAASSRCTNLTGSSWTATVPRRRSRPRRCRRRRTPRHWRWRVR